MEGLLFPHHDVSKEEVIERLKLKIEVLQDKIDYIISLDKIPNIVKNNGSNSDKYYISYCTSCSTFMDVADEIENLLIAEHECSGCRKTDEEKEQEGD